MNEKLTRTIASLGLFIGGIFGVAGSLVSAASFRGLAWGLDGVSLILASALLTIYYFRKGRDIIAAGFLLFIVGEALVMSCNATDLNENVSTFGAGTSLWAASLVTISFQNLFPIFIRLTGFIAAVFFCIVSVQIFTGCPVNALTKPLPFYGYPFFAATIFGWGWILLRRNSPGGNNLT
jgi:hypothetical protein